MIFSLLRRSKNKYVIVEVYWCLSNLLADPDYIERPRILDKEVLAHSISQFSINPYVEVKIEILKFINNITLTSNSDDIFKFLSIDSQV